MVKRREDLTDAARHAGASASHYDPDAFGHFSESIARYLGTAGSSSSRPCIIVVWITLNIAVAGASSSTRGPGLVLLTSCSRCRRRTPRR